MTAKPVETVPPAAEPSEIEALKLRVAALEATVRLLAERAMPPIQADDVAQAAEAAHVQRIRARALQAGAIEGLIGPGVMERVKALRTVVHLPPISLPETIERAIRRLFD